MSWSAATNDDLIRLAQLNVAITFVHETPGFEFTQREILIQSLWAESRLLTNKVAEVANEVAKLKTWPR